MWTPRIATNVRAGSTVLPQLNTAATGDGGWNGMTGGRRGGTTKQLRGEGSREGEDDKDRGMRRGTATGGEGEGMRRGGQERRKSQDERD